MQVAIGTPLLLALGARLFLKSFVLAPEQPPSTPDFLLTGLFMGSLLHHAITQIPSLTAPVSVGIAAKLALALFGAFGPSQCAFELFGTVLGVLTTHALSVIFEENPASGRERSGGAQSREAQEPGRRLRLVSFDRSGHDRPRAQRDGHRTNGRERGNGNGRHHSDDHTRDRERHARRTEVPRAVTPTLTYASTAPSISLESMPSSIDPEGRLTPQERAIAVLRARASLADSERRRFKEERKWALSQGNYARANQLAWQVKRYAALMESFHREADAKVVEVAARATAAQRSVSNPEFGAKPRSSRRQNSMSANAQPSAAGSSNLVPLVSVTVGTRTRKISGGTASLKPAIHVEDLTTSRQRMAVT
ncbi:hypothetical protein OBBRIDRAFT_746235 [Obba rivulosa]|uniref:Uncharacterized protein n=1 Tax=Obba rivulosa TaxID=1052685 RepID=A0A8E2J5N3_9APHY|nr:hypothetical protein OBBRIDRAFT_746235 [Obba rivulosa]